MSTKDFISEFISEGTSEIGVNHRYFSFDFCYNYFQSNKGHLCENLEMSCYCLWSYLASWGMLRGSSELLQKSPVSLKSLVEHFDNIADSPIWSLDVPDYDKTYSVVDGKCIDGMEKIVVEYNEILEILSKNVIKNPTRTLVTKIMLGVFGVVPAFDSYFTETFNDIYPGFGFPFYNKKLTKEQLQCILDFYKENKDVIESFKIPVKDFYGRNTGHEYTKAKLIDMYGFMCGREKEKLNKNKMKQNKK
jgi:hypothetical protein